MAERRETYFKINKIPLLTRGETLVFRATGNQSQIQVFRIFCDRCENMRMYACLLSIIFH